MSSKGSGSERVLEVGLAIIGGGPAGTGPIVQAAWSGRLADYLRDGVALIEEGDRLGSGSLAHYDIRANSAAGTFLESLEHPGSGAVFPMTMSSAVVARLMQDRAQHAPLREASLLLESVAGELAKWFEENDRAHLVRRHRAEHVRELADGRYEVGLRPAYGAESPLSRVIARHVLVATGAKPFVDTELGAMVHAACSRVGTRPWLLTSDDVIARRAAQSSFFSSDQQKQRIVIIGGSHSAFSAAEVLLRDHPDMLAPGSIEIVHRSAIKLYYETTAAAAADGYSEYQNSDTCAQTGRVFRIGGLRGGARELYRRINGFAGCVPENRVKLRRVERAQHPGDWPVDWSEVDGVIFACGYRFREVPIIGATGAATQLLGTFTGRYVDDEGRLLRSDGVPVRGIYAIGAATGFLPQARFGGETSFSGWDTSVWLCQHGLGEFVNERLIGRDPDERSSSERVEDAN